MSNEFEVDVVVENEDVQVSGDNIPDRNSPEWSDWVLDQLVEGEYVLNENKDKCPKADGLLRLVRLLVGETSYNMQVHHVTEGYAAVTVVASSGGDLGYNVCHGSAECSSHNTDDPYSKYPLATAETRAYGRVAKRLLGLNNVLTAEETSKKAAFTTVESVDRTEGPITTTQAKLIETLCKKLKIDVKEAVVHLLGDFDSIKELTHSNALEVQATLDEWTRNGMPEDLVFGEFNKDWKQDFGG